MPDYSTVSGFVNVKDYGAKGDGVTDDTAALRDVFGRHKDDTSGAIRHIYLPKGTYLVSDTVLWGDKKKDVRGEDMRDTVIKLKDNCPGFDAPLVPKKVLSTEYGFGGQNFNQRICDLTVDVGKGNLGAIGIGFHTNNMGGLTNVIVRSSDPDKLGHTGIMMHKDWPGPGLIRQVEVDGFDIGIDIMHDQYGMTFEQITLKNQRSYGFVNNGNTVAIRALNSTNGVPAVLNGGPTALMSLLNANLRGGAIGEDAIINEENGILMARNVYTDGYTVGIRNGLDETPSGNINDFLSHPRLSCFPVVGAPIRLPIKTAPSIPMGDPRTWVSIEDVSGAIDDGDAIQKAIDEGADTIYLPPGAYNSARTIYVRNKVRRIIGFGATLKFWTPGQPGFVIENGSAAAPMAPFAIDLERALDSQETFWVEHASRRPLVQRWGTYTNTVTGGEVFIEDTSTVHLVFNKQKAWLRQCNPESYDFNPLIENNGGDLWILGLKSEKDRTIIRTTNGGRTEVFGALLYKNNERLGQVPAFIIEDSQANLCYRNKGLDYSTQVMEKREGAVEALLVGEIPSVNRRRVSLFVSKA
jgi:hypothetical protein